jgi:NADPH2:quinone reductase
MRAAYYEKNGPANEVLQVGEIDTPVPGSGEVRVRLATSGVNPSDTKARAGSNRKIAFARVVPHSDGAGEIDAVGEGIDKTRIGERVWTWDAQWQRPIGTCGEYTVIPSDRAVRLPDTVGFDVGACLGIPVRTARHAVAMSDIGSGDTVFITGGAGSVSHYAIQFAKARGANVVTTVSTDDKAGLAEEAGADHIINYCREEVGSRVRDITAGAGVDAMIELDLAANAMLIPEIVRPHGNVIVYGTGRPVAELPMFFCLFNAIAVRFMFLYILSNPDRRVAEEEITTMLEAGRLRHNIAATFNLSDSVAAHEAVEQGMVAGNVIVTI